MKAKRSLLAIFVLGILNLSGADFLLKCSGLALGESQGVGQATVARRIGAIKAINGNAITLTPDSGADVMVTVQSNARILRIAPGEKDLKNAAPVQLQDLQVGDRVRVRGQASADGTSMAALEVIVIPHSDLQALHEQERQDWQKRGLGGLVSAVDPATGTITISVTSVGGKKEIAVHTSKSTVFRRYAQDSVKFDDAKPSTAAGNSSGRSTPGARRSQPRRFAGDGRRNRYRKFPQRRGAGEHGGRKFRHHYRSRSIEQEARASEDYF